MGVKGTMILGWHRRVILGGKKKGEVERKGKGGKNPAGTLTQKDREASASIHSSLIPEGGRTEGKKLTPKNQRGRTMGRENLWGR